MPANYKSCTRLKEQIRLQLFVELGMFCKHCGTTEQLEFDLIIPALDDRHHRFTAYRRALFYRREHQKKNVQVLCHVCNGRKGLNERYLCPVESAESPF